MTHVISQKCVGTKSGDCVEVCPVDCIHPKPDEPDFEGAEMLYINPSECIDCGACVAVCPVEAIYPDDSLPDEYKADTEKNAAYFAS